MSAIRRASSGLTVIPVQLLTAMNDDKRHLIRSNRFKHPFCYIVLIPVFKMSNNRRVSSFFSQAWIQQLRWTIQRWMSVCPTALNFTLKSYHNMPSPNQSKVPVHVVFPCKLKYIHYNSLAGSCTGKGNKLLPIADPLPSSLSSLSSLTSTLASWQVGLSYPRYSLPPRAAIVGLSAPERFSPRGGKSAYQEQQGNKNVSREVALESQVKY